MTIFLWIVGLIFVHFFLGIVLTAKTNAYMKSIHSTRLSGEGEFGFIIFWPVPAFKLLYMIVEDTTIDDLKKRKAELAKTQRDLERAEQALREL